MDADLLAPGETRYVLYCECPPNTNTYGLGSTEIGQCIGTCPQLIVEGRSLCFGQLSNSQDAQFSFVVVVIP